MVLARYFQTEVVGHNFRGVSESGMESGMNSGMIMTGIQYTMKFPDNRPRIDVNPMLVTVHRI